MVFESRVIFIIIDKSLESCVSTNRLSRPSLDMVDVVVVEESEVRRGARCPT